MQVQNKSWNPDEYRLFAKNKSHPVPKWIFPWLQFISKTNNSQSICKTFVQFRICINLPRFEFLARIE